ncbi:MAG: protein kinase [Acidobacteriota bacterium]
MGRGGMGEVYLAYDRRLDRRVAIKRLRLTDAEDPKAGGPEAKVPGTSGPSPAAPPAHRESNLRERFRREAWATARLSHPSVVPIYDIVQDDADADDWLVMEYVDGPTLAQRLAAGPVGIPTALLWSRQVAEGLAEAHGKGILHRDLKTENVILDGAAAGGYDPGAPGRARIVDFGLAKVLKPPADDLGLTVDGALLGTVRAMSPEQARGLPLDPRSDLFSLGVLLYELLAGTPPFTGRTPAATLMGIVGRSQRPVTQLRPEVPAEVADLVERLLEKTPELRPPSASAVARELTEQWERLRVDGPGALADMPGESTFYGSGLAVEDLARPAGAEAADPPPTRDGAQGDASGPRGADTGRVTAGTRRRSARRVGVPLGLAFAVSVLAAGAWVVWEPGRLANGGIEPRAVHAGSSGTSTGSALGSAGERTVQEWIGIGWRDLREYHREGRLTSAIEAFQKAVALRPSSALAHAGLSRAYWRSFWAEGHDRQWLEQALAVAQRAVELDEYLAQAWISLGCARAALSAGDEAEAAFTQALELDPLAAEAYRGLGDLASAEGDMESAERHYGRAVELAPDIAEYSDELGSLLYRQGRLDGASARFEASLQLEPGRAASYRNLAAVRHMQGRPAEAASLLQRALELEPTSVTYVNLGTLLFYQGLYAKAADAFEKALALGGAQRPEMWLNLGDAQRWSPGLEEQALDSFRHGERLLRAALRSRPLDPDLGSRLALCLAKLGDPEAADQLARSRPRATGLPSPLYRLASAAEILGDRELALDLLGAALTAGFPIEEASRDPELRGLRRAPEFQRLLGAVTAEGAPPKPS